MNKHLLIAALAAMSISTFAGATNASANGFNVGQVIGPMMNMMRAQQHRSQSVQCCVRQPAPVVVYQPHIQRRIIGYRRVVVRRAIIERQVVTRPVMVTPPVVQSAPTQVAPNCNGCAVDLQVTDKGCLVEPSGKQVWLYLAQNGNTYKMDMPRRNPADMIRIQPNGQIVWVKG